MQAEQRLFLRNLDQISVWEIDDILADLFCTYESFPPCTEKFREEFDEKAYTNWAIGEVEDYINEYIYPETRVYVDEVIDIINNFIRKMEHYEKASKKHKDIFYVGECVAVELVQILEDAY